MSRRPIYCQPLALSLGPVELVPSTDVAVVGKISDFSKHIVDVKQVEIFERRSRTIEYCNRANKFVVFVQREFSVTENVCDQSPVTKVRRSVCVSLASKPPNCLPSPSLSNLAIHSSYPVSFSVLHPSIILHCHHSLALARIGHAARHFVNNTMTTNFVSVGLSNRKPRDATCQSELC